MESGGVFHADLPAGLTSARHARSAVRQTLAAWDMDHLSDDAELLASELVANAVEHGDGQPIRIALRCHTGPGARPGITCEVIDTSLAMPRRIEVGADAERGRGLAIVAALAKSSGVCATQADKTTWFTLPSPTALTPPPGSSTASPKPAHNPGLSKEHTTMAHPADDSDARFQASTAAHGAIRRLASDRGFDFTPSPAGRRLGFTTRDLESLTGARAARDIELATRKAARDYIRQAREAGHGWDQIGHALGLAPNADADQAGLTVAEATYTYAAGNPHTDTAIRYGRSFVWRCLGCDQAISDRGLIAGPADNEIGHADDCSRLAAAVAEWDAGLDADREVEP
jgi:anti-sigma regulatory factor (Ser/Thr protein kinase)